MCKTLETAGENMAINKYTSISSKDLTIWEKKDKISNLFNNCVCTNARQTVINTEEATRIQGKSPFWIVSIGGGIKEVDGFAWGLKRWVNVQK